MIDSEHLQSKAFEKVLRDHGVEPKLNAAGIVQIVGMKARDNWIRLRDAHALDAPVDTLLAKKEKAYLRMITEGVYAMPGLHVLLDELGKHPVKVAIASSSRMPHITLVLSHLNKHYYFDAIVSGDGVKHGKPAPDIFLQTAEQLDVKPSNCLVLEDASSGVIAAEAAGMKVIAVPNRFTKDHDFSKADLVVPSLDKITYTSMVNLVSE